MECDSSTAGSASTTRTAALWLVLRAQNRILRLAFNRLDGARLLGEYMRPVANTILGLIIILSLAAVSAEWQRLAFIISGGVNCDSPLLPPLAVANNRSCSFDVPVRAAYSHRVSIEAICGAPQLAPLSAFPTGATQSCVFSHSDGYTYRVEGRTDQTGRYAVPLPISFDALTRANESITAQCRQRNRALTATGGGDGACQWMVMELNSFAAPNEIADALIDALRLQVTVTANPYDSKHYNSEWNTVTRSEQLTELTTELTAIRLLPVGAPQQPQQPKPNGTQPEAAAEPSLTIEVGARLIAACGAILAVAQLARTAVAAVRRRRLRVLQSVSDELPAPISPLQTVDSTRVLPYEVLCGGWTVGAATAAGSPKPVIAHCSTKLRLTQSVARAATPQRRIEWLLQLPQLQSPPAPESQSVRLFWLASNARFDGQHTPSLSAER